MLPIIESDSIVIMGTCFVGEYTKSVIDENGVMQVEKQKLYTHTPSLVIDFETDLHEHYNESVVKVLNNKIEETELRGSGFKISEIIELNIQVSSFAPLAGSSYIPLPTYLFNKKAIVNVKNEDDEMCFQYAVLSALYPVKKNGQRSHYYTNLINAKVLDFTGINFPVQLRDIAKFEKQNANLAIHVYMFNEVEKAVYTVRLSKQPINIKRIHLLLLTNDTDRVDDDGGLIINNHRVSLMTTTTTTRNW